MNYQVGYVTLLLIVSLSYARIHEEPSCSKFLFEEKVLEKLVRLEHRMEVWEEKINDKIRNMKETEIELIDQIEKYTSDMKEEETTRTDKMEKHISNIGDLETTQTNKLDELQDLVKQNVENQKTKLQEMLSDFNQQVIRMSEDLMTKQSNANKTLKEFIKQQELSVNKIRDELAIPIVAFNARTVADKSPSSGNMIRYTETDINVGGGYDTATGYFTAPTDGVYMFTVQLCNRNSDDLGVHIMAAGNVIERMYNGDTNYATCSTGTALVVLSLGNKVWIKCTDSSVAIEDNYRWNTFSGILIHVGSNKPQ